MIMADFIIEILFFTVCGWVGHIVLKLLSFGRIDLDWGRGAESVAAELFGFFFLLFTAGLIAWIAG
jgi:hypothetical protein